MWNWLRPRDSEWCWLIVGVCFGFITEPAARFLARIAIKAILALVGARA